MTTLTGTPFERMAAVVFVYDDAIARGASHKQATDMRRAFVRGEPVPDFESIDVHFKVAERRTDCPTCIDCAKPITVVGGRCRPCNMAYQHSLRKPEWPEPARGVMICDRCGQDVWPRAAHGVVYCRRCAAIVRWHPEEAVG